MALFQPWKQQNEKFWQGAMAKGALLIGAASAGAACTLISNMKRPSQTPSTAALALISLLNFFSAATPTARGASINVPNFSFEADPVNDVSARAGATGWIGSVAFFTQNSGNESFIGAAGAGVPPGANGPQQAVLTDFGEEVNFFQSAAPLLSLTAGATYRLTIAIGDFLHAKSEPGTLRIGFLVDDSFVGGGDTIFSGTNYAPEGAFRDFSFDYTAQASDAGKGLKIYVSQLGHGNGGNNVDVAFDNVRLETVPEPSAALLLLSAGGLGGAFWRRRCAPRCV